MPDFTGDDILGLIIAALGGAAVGLERQWSGHAEGPAARFAGIRTFTLLGATGGLSGLLWSGGLASPAVVVLAGAVAIIAAAYLQASRHDIGGTTEVAALVVVTAGMLAGVGSWRISSGIIAVTCLLLVEKSRLHALVAQVDDLGLRAGVRFAVMALVVLPLLPKGPYGPLGGIRPRELWALVLFFSGLSFLGYIARRFVGTGRGYLVAGALGGLISSTNVTFTFARMSHADSPSARGLGCGAVAANAMLYPRVLVATVVLNPPLALPVAPYLVVPFLIAATVALLGLRSAKGGETQEAPLTNPLQLVAALQMAILFQAVLMLVYLARGLWGEAGLLSSAAVLGLTDVDALTATMARSVAPTTTLEAAALAIGIGVLSNTTLKMALALVLGRDAFRKIAGGTLALMLAGAAASIVLLA